MRSGFCFPVFSGCLLLLSVMRTAGAQIQVAGTQSAVTTYQGKLDSDGFPVTGAKLCVASDGQHCFQMPASSSKGEKPGFYQFGLEPQWERLTTAQGGTWLLFSATFSGGGIGTLTRYAILCTERNGDQTVLVDLLPDVALTNNSDHAIWNERRISPYPLFLTADFVWNFKAGETHFSPHRFQISAWQFDPAENKYVRATSYVTSRKYNGLDAVDQIRVLAPERPNILRHLLPLNPHP